MTIPSPKRGNWDIFLSNLKLMIAGPQINLRVHVGTLELIKKIVNPQNSILNSTCRGGGSPGNHQETPQESCKSLSRLAVASLLVLTP
nr:hypothetical protein [Tanacetum cinerariifolium]